MAQAARRLTDAVDGFLAGHRILICDRDTITAGVPLGGFNGDDQAADQTEFSEPADIVITRTGQVVVADTANGPMRRFAR